MDTFTQIARNETWLGWKKLHELQFSSLKWKTSRSFITGEFDINDETAAVILEMTNWTTYILNPTSMAQAFGKCQHGIKTTYIISA